MNQVDTTWITIPDRANQREPRYFRWLPNEWIQISLAIKQDTSQIVFDKNMGITFNCIR